MQKPVVLMGIGEIGGVFARGFLRTGHAVFPVTRSTPMREAVETVTDPALVLVAVAEADLNDSLDRLPGRWRDKAGLLQNELLPADWESHGLTDPTVVSVWFEKKKGQDSKVLLPSPVYGPQADLLHDALAAVDIPARILTSREQLLFELVRKNVYILTTNIAGLVTGGTVAELWQHHQKLALEVAEEVIRIQEHLTGVALARDRLIAGMVEAFNADPDHKCMGRTAPARLIRALAHADQAGLSVPRLREIQTNP